MRALCVSILSLSEPCPHCPCDASQVRGFHQQERADKLLLIEQPAMPTVLPQKASSLPAERAGSNISTDVTVASQSPLL